MTTVSLMNADELARTRTLGGTLGATIETMVEMVTKASDIITDALTRAGQKPDPKAKSATKARLAAIAKCKDEFAGALVSGHPAFVACIGASVKLADATVVTGGEWRKYLRTFSPTGSNCKLGTRGKPTGKGTVHSKLGTAYNVISEAFIGAGYRETFRQAKAKDEAEGGTAEETAPVQEEVKVDVSSVAALVKFFADRKVPVQNIVEALAIHSVAVGSPLPTAPAPMSKPEMILEVATMPTTEIASVLGLEGGMELACRLADALQPVE